MIEACSHGCPHQSQRPLWAFSPALCRLPWKCIYCGLLLRNGGDPNTRGNHLSTPLHSAAWGKNQEVVELLLEDGAEVDAQTDEQETPVMTATLRGQLGNCRNFTRPVCRCPRRRCLWLKPHGLGRSQWKY